MRYGIVSGYFNPVHRGHIDYFQESQRHCDYLFAIINNDAQVKIKGSKPFMDELERQRIVAAIRYVDEAVVSLDRDSSVSKTIIFVREIISSMCKEEHTIHFFNSGDRDPGTYNLAENDVCEKYGVIPFFLDLPKVNSSSKLLK